VVEDIIESLFFLFLCFYSFFCSKGCNGIESSFFFLSNITYCMLPWTPSKPPVLINPRITHDACSVSIVCSVWEHPKPSARYGSPLLYLHRREDNDSRSARVECTVEHFLKRGKQKPDPHQARRALSSFIARPPPSFSTNCTTANLSMLHLPSYPTSL
jgi:hypothetical protein